MLGWNAVVFIITAGVAALLAFIVARQAEGAFANAAAYVAGVLLTAAVYVGGTMVIDHTVTLDLRALLGGLAPTTVVAPFAGAAMGLWWARQYRAGR